MMSDNRRLGDTYSIDIENYELLCAEEATFIKRVFAMMKRNGPKGPLVLKKRHQESDESLPYHYPFGLSTYCDNPHLAKQLLTRKQANPSRLRRL